MNVTVGLEQAVLDVIREEIRSASQEHVPARLYNVASAATYLDTSEEAVRGLIKRRQIEFNKSATGRITFTRDQLNSYATGGAV
jgi:hypothetical protein